MTAQMPRWAELGERVVITDDNENVLVVSVAGVVGGAVRLEKVVAGDLRHEFEYTVATGDLREIGNGSFLWAWDEQALRLIDPDSLESLRIKLAAEILVGVRAQLNLTAGRDEGCRFKDSDLFEIAESAIAVQRAVDRLRGLARRKERRVSGHRHMTHRYDGQ